MHNCNQPDNAITNSVITDIVKRVFNCCDHDIRKLKLDGKHLDANGLLYFTTLLKDRIPENVSSGISPEDISVEDGVLKIRLSDGTVLEIPLGGGSAPELDLATGADIDAMF